MCANIKTSKEDAGEKLTYDSNTGIYTYEPSGTYGQSDYTVRERKDEVCVRNYSLAIKLNKKVDINIYHLYNINKRGRYCYEEL